MRLKRAGLNTVETYAFWNVHEPAPGQFDFEGENDLTFNDFEADILAPRRLSLEVYDSIFQLFKVDVKDVRLNFFNTSIFLDICNI